MQTAVQVLRDQGPQASVEQRDRVVAWLAKAGRQDPDATSLALLLADLRSLEGRDAEAVTIYRGLIGRRDLPPPEAAAVAHRLALRLAKPATAAEAERLLAAAVAEMGPTPEVLDARGCVLLAVGKTREAVAALEDAVLVPSPTKFLHLACALAADGQIKNAREALLKARTLGLDPRTLTVDDRTRLASLESTLGS
jgi:tetratricopeptide (TPR) repeat protein